jgi:hypothetical protein
VNSKLCLINCVRCECKCSKCRPFSGLFKTLPLAEDLIGNGKSALGNRNFLFVEGALRFISRNILSKNILIITAPHNDKATFYYN